MDGWGFFALFFSLACLPCCLPVRCFELGLAVVVSGSTAQYRCSSKKGISMVLCDGRSCLSCALALSWSVVY
ncbi:hypothetical protein B9Z19DRAFT_1088185 [Tuber borchii]|uniref:Secreted protein n=1 Tax=Tuber borchii TaxID=42251 RepID=A0A2T6ZM24_TUBBO|nr:hypothetical protein B9Z19DRAFT_1088185 [Tuber borchii]